MKELNEILSEILKQAFNECGYASNNINVVPCVIEGFGDFQCNNAMPLAKEYKKNPLVIAEEVVNKINNNNIIEKVIVAKPGFINIYVNNDFLSEYMQDFVKNINVDAKNSTGKTMIIDYGGPNVAKPLHIGHLRSAIIGESLKRIAKYVGHNVLGDIHIGDWGRQMGMVIMGIRRKYPNLPYFDENFTGEYPTECPVTIQELENIYPQENLLAKENPQVMEEDRKATFELQNGRRGYVELWKRFLKISIDDVKKIYKQLNVDFELWLGESDAHPYIPRLLEKLQDKDLLTVSEGAMVVNVEKEDDKITIPPCIILKSDGAVMYASTDLATIMQRKQDYNPNSILYLTDNRQNLHFTQVFRVAEKMGLTVDGMKLEHIGFGTMNGKDGKPYKTRDGQVMKLSTLINEVKEKAKNKIKSEDVSKEKLDEIVDAVFLATLKFADLSNTVTKDYIFDIDKFSEFEGKTGPYLLYTVTRIKSLLSKCGFNENNIGKIIIKENIEKQILLNICAFNNTVNNAHNDKAPNYLCDMAYKLANMFSTFYASFNIVNEKDLSLKQSRMSICYYTLLTLEKLLYLLGIKTIDKM